MSQDLARHRWDDLIDAVAASLGLTIDEAALEATRGALSTYT